MRPHLFLLGLTAATAATAQVRIDSHGIQAGGTTIDAGGIHTGAARHGGGARTINANGTTRDVDCGGGSLVLDGNHNRFAVAGCRRVTVAGDDNDLRVRFGAAGSLTVSGNRNHVAWHAPQGSAVAVSNSGNGSTVDRD